MTSQEDQPGQQGQRFQLTQLEDFTSYTNFLETPEPAAPGQAYGSTFHGTDAFSPSSPRTFTFGSNDGYIYGSSPSTDNTLYAQPNALTPEWITSHTPSTMSTLVTNNYGQNTVNAGEFNTPESYYAPYINGSDPVDEATFSPISQTFDFLELTSPSPNQPPPAHSPKLPTGTLLDQPSTNNLACTDCVRTFVSPKNKARHYHSKHNKFTRQFKCACGYTVPQPRRDNYTRHLGKCAYGVPYHCACGSQTTDKSEHAAHVKACGLKRPGARSRASGPSSQGNIHDEQ
ncbi:hypothetical protein B0H63DRAFT_528947 [Podospora didyma]|uniref:C2H2-type domain-containing protein n=1 Tax=Podospora didyma TaxID=330526 RepID=A0AAE0K347_9PEZI|nr:hypothetical protein B0H63DRAFT_528947 [Podospora didyma]